jgi:hypothetical protein
MNAYIVAMGAVVELTVCQRDDLAIANYESLTALGASPILFPIESCPHCHRPMTTTFEAETTECIYCGDVGCTNPHAHGGSAAINKQDGSTLLYFPVGAGLPPEPPARAGYEQRWVADDRPQDDSWILRDDVPRPPPGDLVLCERPIPIDRLLPPPPGRLRNAGNIFREKVVIWWRKHRPIRYYKDTAEAYEHYDRSDLEDLAAQYHNNVERQWHVIRLWRWGTIVALLVAGLLVFEIVLENVYGR